MDEIRATADELHRLKREQPFKPFDITTAEGKNVHVSGRFMFSFNERYVLVGDERDKVTRVPLRSIAKIVEKPALN